MNAKPIFKDKVDDLATIVGEETGKYPTLIDSISTLALG